MCGICAGSLFCGRFLKSCLIFATILLRKGKMFALLLKIVFLLSCGCQSSVSLPHGTICCNVIVAISSHTHLLSDGFLKDFFVEKANHKTETACKITQQAKS